MSRVPESTDVFSSGAESASAAIADPFVRGSDYLNRVRQLALDPSDIELPEDINDRIRICTWIGEHGDAVNAELQSCLDACHQCFGGDRRRPMRILAAPLAERLGVDALCNIHLDPVVIFVDVGRIDPADWLSVVVHEYAHAHLKSPGHGRSFLEVVTHLCLGLGLPPPTVEGTGDAPDDEKLLRHWPHCQSTRDPQRWWRGSP